MIPAAELAGVSRAFGTRYVLRRLDLTLSRGEAVAVTGPNGAGKTTLLRILATLLAPTSGQVRLFGLPPDEHGPSVRRRIGALFVDGFLYGELTVRENLDLYARMYGLEDRAATVSAWLDRLGMRPLEDERVSTLSHGERQRIALARSLLNEPELLLWDEPTTGLDPAARRLVNELAARFKGSRAILCATHDPDAFAPWVDRVVRLEGGRWA